MNYFANQSEASRILEINDSEVNKMLKGKRMTCHGWRFYKIGNELLNLLKNVTIEGEV